MENFKRNLVKEALSAPSKLKVVGQLLIDKIGANLSQFATSVCEKFSFKDDHGNLQTQNCCKALKALDSQGLIDLQSLDYTPKKGETPHAPICLNEHVSLPVGVPDSVDSIDGLSLQLVTSDEDKKVFYTLLRDEHYLGENLPPGRRISYIIKSENGLLGVISFSSPANRLMPRDSWIGWTDQVRKEKLDCVLNLSRFHIRPGIHCKNLETTIINMALESVQKDCLMRYKFSPYIVEVFADSAHPADSCYNAAGWEMIGETKGRGRNDHHHTAQLPKKQIFVKVLQSDFRDRLGITNSAPSEEKKIPDWVIKGALEPTDNTSTHEWASMEFGSSKLGHKDRNVRLIHSAEMICKNPHFSANVAFKGDNAACKGWYRLIDTKQKDVSFDSILSGPEDCTCRRMKSQKTVLIVQDDSKLNFTSKPCSEGFGNIGTNQTGAVAKGCIIHSSLAMTTSGLPLGLLKATCFVRSEVSEEEKSKKRTAEEKESYLWTQHAQYINEVGQYMPDTKLITVCDRGADISFFIYECHEMEHCDLIVRAKSDRNIPGETQSLFTLLKTETVAGQVEVAVPRRSERPKLSGSSAVEKRKERKAILDIRFRPVKISPPPERKGQSPIEVYAVSAIEKNPPAGEEGISWFILTTLPVNTFDDAYQCVQFYSKRWGIEEFHRMLKTGCQVESLAHKDVTRITRALAVYMVVACRLMLLLKLGRELPDLSPEVLLDDIEISVLKTIFKGKKARPLTTLYDAIVLIAKLGGYLDRKNDPPPGYEVFWKGYSTFQNMCDYAMACRE